MYNGLELTFPWVLHHMGLSILEDLLSDHNFLPSSYFCQLKHKGESKRMFTIGWSVNNNKMPTNISLMWHKFRREIVPNTGANAPKFFTLATKS